MANRSISTILFSALALTLVLALGGCVTPKSAPGIDSEGNSGIGIEIKLPRLGLNRQEPQIVYFVRLDKEANVLQPAVIRSSHARNGRIYLLNLPPGRYAAVAAFHYRIVVNLPGNPAPTPALGDRLGFVTYFSDEMVMKSITDVGQSEIAFAGSYVADQANCCKHADATQRHFASILHWRRTTDWPDPEKIYSIDFLYAGTMREANRDEATKAAFFRAAKEDLAGDWSSLIR